MDKRYNMKPIINTAIFLLSLAGISPVAAHAQATSAAAPKIQIGITGGVSLPSGNFSKSDYADDKAGFASTGSNFGVTGTYFINKRWGITALVAYHSFSFKGAQNLADGFKEAFDIDSSTVDVNGTNHCINFLAGPYYVLPVAKKLDVTFRAMAGITAAHLAGYQVAVEDQAAATFSQKEASATTFAAQGGLGINYRLTRLFGIGLNVDYFYSKPDFTIDNVNRTNAAGRKIDQYNQPLTAVTTNLTLTYTIK